MNWTGKKTWCFAFIACLIFAAGCPNGTTTTPPIDDPPPVVDPNGGGQAGGGHGHETGPGGGRLAVLGSHEYHAEVLGCEESGVVDAIVTDDKFKPVPIDATELRLNMVVDGASTQYILPVVETAEGEPAKFSLTDPVLAELICDGTWEGEAKVAIMIGGTPYSDTLAKPEAGEHAEHEEAGHEEAGHEEAGHEEEGHEEDGHEEDGHEEEGHEEDGPEEAEPAEEPGHEGHNH